MSGFSLDTSEIDSWLDSLESKSDKAMGMYADNAALKLQNYARDKAPWTDRTGHARQRLSGTNTRVTKGYKITLAHGVDYGIWLELAMEKRFAILEPTVRLQGQEVLRGMNRLLEEL